MAPAGLARRILPLFIVALAAMRPTFTLLGYQAVAADLLFVALAAAWGAMLLRSRAWPEWNPAYALIACYFGAMALSAAADPGRSAAKLATQLYLVAIPVVIAGVVRTEADLRQAVRWWLAGAAAMVGIAIVALAAFAIDPQSAVYRWASFHQGSLPNGHYPRLAMSFSNGNLAANYLVVSFVLALLAGRLGWVERRRAMLLASGIAIATLSTLSPGIGGLGLAAGLWGWLAMGSHSPRAKVALGAGIAFALLLVALAALEPVALLHGAFDPSIRAIIWGRALASFLGHPWLGRGIGANAVEVAFVAPNGDWQLLTDAHNAYLSIAVQCGLAGLAALVALIVHVRRRSDPRSGLAAFALGSAFLNGLAYQGLTGSFEDARHLWAILGLFIAARQIARAAPRGDAAERS